MDKFFKPAAIAMIGASADGLGNSVIKNLLKGFAGPIYPVNPNYTEIERLPCHPSLEAIPLPVDLAIILVPAGAIPDVLKACGRKGIRRVIIESAGFSEVGQAGSALQARCAAIAKEAGIRIWGPNCMGLVDLHHRHFFTFMHERIHEEGLIPGRISLIVQSGMMSAIFLAEMARRGIGIAKVCSIGNKMDVDECDLLPYLLEDEHTDVVALYLESIPRGRRLAEIASRSAKPILLLLGGRSQSGARAALSHTSSLAANSRLSDGVLESAGVIRCEDIYQMMDVANALAFLPGVPASCRTAIVTLSGGAGILACDALESRGIPVARLAEKTERKLGEIFPAWMPVSNPVDLFPAMGLHGRSAALKRALSAVFDDPHTDVVLVNLVVGLEEGLPDFEALRRKADTAGKAVLFWLMGRREETYRFHQKAREAGILAYREISRAAECLAGVAGYRSRQESPLPQFQPAAPDPEGEKPSPASYCRNRIWDEFDSKRLLSDWKIPVASEKTAHTVQEALSAADALGYPIVLKGLVPGEVHKTEHGLVELGIAGRAQLKDAVGRMRNRLGSRGRMLVQRQLKIDYELIAGFIRDERFGPCVMFGLGGILAELEPDVAFAMAPLDRAAALSLMEKVRARRLLQGFRRIPALDKEKMALLLMGLGDLGCANPEIEQIDINPVAVSDGVPVAIDASVILTV